MPENQKKRCFVITPIGDETDPIRRHIDGIIEAAIRPALEEKYEIVVAHKITDPGSITKQIITEIYRDDLVIANLTNKNPNVMYELAFRHSLGKPVIMIAEKGTALPSDIIMERTIFYHNDAQGTLDLRDELKRTETGIDFEHISSPIYDVLREIDATAKIIEASGGDGTGDLDSVLGFVLKKLDNIESKVQTSRTTQTTPRYYSRRIRYVYSEYSGKDDLAGLERGLEEFARIFPGIEVKDVDVDFAERQVTISVMTASRMSWMDLVSHFEKALSALGFAEVKPVL